MLTFKSPTGGSPAAGTQGICAAALGAPAALGTELRAERLGETGWMVGAGFRELLVHQLSLDCTECGHTPGL